MIKSLIFDLGGVLIDDGDNVLDKFLDLTPQESREIYKLVYEDSRWSQGVMLGKISQIDYMQTLIQEYPEHKKTIEKMFLPGMQPIVLPIFDKNLEYVLRLKKTGKYNLYILSNLTDETYKYVKNIRDVFDGGAYSCIEGVKKPDKEFYAILLRRYNLNPEECVFFDDREKNVQAAEKIGIKGSLVKTPGELEYLVAKMLNS